MSAPPLRALIAAVAMPAILLASALALASGSRRQAPVAPPSADAATYREECGACHLAYPPGLLPADSWRRIMAGLDAHFGENAELPEADRARLEAYLVSAAAESRSHRVSRKVLRSTTGEPPLRVSEVPYVRRKHHEIKEAVFRRESIGSRANCPACHRTAERWSFDEDHVKIPRR